MKVICAWCDSLMVIKEGPVAAVSHGICQRCRRVNFPTRFERFLSRAGEFLLLAASIGSICWGIARAI